MATYAYRAADGRGEVRSGLLQGADAGAVKAALQREGLYPIELEERAVAQPGTSGMRDAIQRLRPASSELPALTRALASFLGAGFPIDRSLQMAAELVAHPRLAASVRGVRREIQQGRSLAAALESRPDLFDPLYVSTVAAGERAGALETALANLASHLEERRELRRQLQSTLLYPVIMALVGSLAVAVLLLFVIPRFVEVLEGTGQNLPWATALLVDVSRALTRFGWALILLAVVAYAALRGYLNSASGRLAWDRRKLRLPLAGAFVKKVVAARFARALGTLLQNGVPLPSALRLAAETVGNTAVAQSVRDAQARVKEGESLAGALGRADAFPPTALRMAAVGEETGRLEDMLLRTAELYEGEVRRDLRTLVGLVEPLMILLLGGLVGFVALAMIQAIFSVNDVPA